MFTTPRPRVRRTIRRRGRVYRRPASSKAKKLESLAVRMYRQGLGDCFLLTFRNRAGQIHHMLIDCGILQGTKGGADRTRLVAADLLNTTEYHLHTVVATHEHWDHISGFAYARKIFGLDPDEPSDRAVKVDQVWLGWTENPEDEQVENLIQRKNALALAISAAEMGMDEAEKGPIEELLRFRGDYSKGEDEQIFAASKQGGSKLREIMGDLRGWGEVRYLEPDDILELPEFGVKFYVLGPSRRMKMLGGAGTGEMSTDRGFRLNASTAFLAAAAKNYGLDVNEMSAGEYSQSDLDELFALSQPFDSSKGIPLEMLKKAETSENAGATEQNQADVRQFFQEVYGFADEPGHGPAWQRIDQDWLQTAETLALQEVSVVNNTSLVLAIELVESGKVLLFPGDAEEESWETWENKAIPDLGDLFKRTVLYKVGHHGSINATLMVQGEGLYLMNNLELTAMIPVDKVRAEKQDWNFPAPVLYAELEKRTRGRIILNCEEECASCEPTFDPAKFTPGQVEKDPSDKKLWVEFTLEL